MKKSKRVLCCLAAAALMLLSACGEKSTGVTTNSGINDENVTAPGELPIVKEKITLELGMKNMSTVIDYDTNAFTLWLEEKTGIDLQFTLFPASTSDALTKLDVMLASDTKLPEVLIHFALSDAVFLKNAPTEVFLDLTQYMDEKGYWFNKMLETSETKNLEKHLISANGKKYYMPSLTEQTGNLHMGKAWINNTWMKALNLEMPKTTEDFREVLRAFKNNDPNGNGLADEVPMSGNRNGFQQNAVHFLMNAFIYCDQSDYYIVENGKVDVAYMQEEWRDGLRYISELVKEGLLDDQCVIQDVAASNAIATNPEINILGSIPGPAPDMMTSMPERMGEYVGLPPLEGPGGACYSHLTAWKPTVSGIITKYCENPLAAFRLLDFMLSEEASLRGRYGVPGTDWKEAKEGDICMFENIGAAPRVETILPYGTVEQNSHWQSMHPTFRNKAISDGMTWDGDPNNAEYIKAVALPLYLGKGPDEFVAKLLLLEEESGEMTALKTNIKSYVTESIGMFVLGEKNLDTDWDDYLAELRKMGVERFIELSQIGYDRFNQ